MGSEPNRIFPRSLLGASRLELHGLGIAGFEIREYRARTQVWCIMWAGIPIRSLQSGCVCAARRSLASLRRLHMSRIPLCSPLLSLAGFARRVVRSGRSIVGFALFLLVFAGGSRAFAAAGTSTTLAVTSQGSAVTTVASGTVVTLTATVTVDSVPVTLGTVNFCDASAKYCTDIHIVGTAQLTAAGTAAMKFRPGVGSHNYKAVFAGTTSNAASTSRTAALTVTKSGLYATSTTIAQSGSVGNYTLTATVNGTGLSSTAPTGTVSFLDTSNGNAVLGTAVLGTGTVEVGWLVSPNRAGQSTGQSIAVGDFNGDGIPDLAVGGYGTTVLLGNGDGTFTATASPAAGVAPVSIVVGDFNGDGIPDLAEANYYNGTVTVLLGNGDGTFTAMSKSPATGQYPDSIAVGDFNRDGILDLAVANEGSDTVTVLLGNGDGTFTAVFTSPATGQHPGSPAVGDFNGDGIPDLAVPNYGGDTVTVLLGNGDGTFTVTASPAAGSAPRSIAAGDFNGDGIPDLAVANYGGDTVTVLLGKGDGTFTAASTIGVGDDPVSIVVGDFNGDGIPDLAVANEGGDTVTVLLGNGDGTFTATPTIWEAERYDAISIAVGDFNGDGIPDLAVASYVDYTVLLREGTQTATATANGIAVPVATTHLVLASYSGDSNFAASTSGTTTLTGPKGTPAVSLTASVNPAPYGTPVTLTATVTGSGNAPTGTATFYNGTTKLATGSLSGGVATYSTAATGTLTLGSYSFVATYSGDSNYVAATSAALSLTVNPGTPTIVWSAPAPITYGTNLSGILDAKAQNGSGTTVPGTFAYTATPAGGTAVAVTAVTILGIGSYTLGVSFAPADTTDYRRVTGSVQLTVTPKAQTITFPNPGTQTYGVAPITLKATASSGLAVSYTVTSGPASVSGNVLTITGAGSVTVQATQGGNATYAAATPVSQTFTVSKAALTVVANNAPVALGAPIPTLTGTLTGVVSGDGITASYMTTAVQGSAVGTYPIISTLNDPNGRLSNYSVTITNGMLVVYNTALALPLWLSSSGATAGGAGFTLTVSGANFTAKSVVLWNGAVRKTTYVSGIQLTAAISAADLAKERTNLVTVANPTPNPGTSAALPFVVMSATPLAKISGGSIAVAAGSSGSQVLTLTGTDFVTSSTVEWNGASLTTTYVSPWQISAVITALDYSSLPAKVTVKNATGTSPGFELR